MKKALLLSLLGATLVGVLASTTVQAQDLLPPARCGECFARILVPAEYKTETEKVLIQEESEVIKVLPAKFEWATEKILVEPGYKKLVPTTAKYSTVTDKVEVVSRHQIWKKGRGPYQNLNNGSVAGQGSSSTGEIMCKVEVDPTYKTYSKKVVAQPAAVKEIEVPAKYQTVKVRKLVEPSKEVRTTIPAKYSTITKRLKTSEARIEWAPILCETNATPATIRQVQRALNSKGYKNSVDGRLGGSTLSAIKRFQADNGLAQGYLTFDTLDKLGVSPLCDGGTASIAAPQQQKVSFTGNKIELMENVFFETNSDVIQKRSYKILNQVANVMSQNDKTFVIEGHTDSQGDNNYNKTLSQKRAESVKRYLSGKGIATARMSPMGFGEAKPIATNDTANGRAKNRRVEFIVK